MEWMRMATHCKNNREIGSSTNVMCDRYPHRKFSQQLDNRWCRHLSLSGSNPNNLSVTYLIEKLHYRCHYVATRPRMQKTMGFHPDPQRLSRLTRDGQSKPRSPVSLLFPATSENENLQGSECEASKGKTPKTINPPVN
jgi:hypothetical protein